VLRRNIVVAGSHGRVKMFKPLAARKQRNAERGEGLVITLSECSQ
jgi:hypothetical protein